MTQRYRCRMVNSTDVVELELKSKRFSLSMRKKEAIAVAEPPQVLLGAIAVACTSSCLSLWYNRQPWSTIKCNIYQIYGGD